MLQGGHDNEENWLPCGGGSNGKQKLFHLEKSTIKEFFPHLSDWIPSDDDNLPVISILYTSKIFSHHCILACYCNIL